MKNKLTHIFTMAAAGLALVSCSNAGGRALSTSKPYPLKTCVVSGNTLGSMGDPVTQVYHGQEMKFCCKPCVRKFNADPAKYLAKLPQ
jgi:YHS domain-containing protein